jgi:hypothetical protein
MNGLKKRILSNFVKSVLVFFDTETLKEFADTVFDFVEYKVENSTNKIDDSVIIPLLSAARRAIGIVEEEGSQWADDEDDMTNK